MKHLIILIFFFTTQIFAGQITNAVGNSSYLARCFGVGGTAIGSNCFQFGSGANTTDNSLQIGEYLRLFVRDNGRPAIGFGDMYFESAGYYVNLRDRYNNNTAVAFGYSGGAYGMALYNRLLMNNKQIKDLAAGTDSSDAVNKSQLDEYTDTSSDRFIALTNALKQAGVF